MLGHVIILTIWTLKLFFKYVTRVLFPVTLTDMQSVRVTKSLNGKI